MIKRKYFFSVKVSHNNGTGNYSYWHDFASFRSFFASPEEVMRDIRHGCLSMLTDEVPREFSYDDVEFICFCRV